MKEYFKLEDFLPELELSDEDLTSIAGIIGHPGFKAYNKVWHHVVSTFAVKTINTEQSDRDLVLARHNASRVAAQLYQTVTNKINQSVSDFIHSRPSDKPIDPTDNLDLGGVLEYTIDGEEPNE